MVMWRVRDFHADDLDAAVRLWDNPAASSEAAAFGLSDPIAAVVEPAVPQERARRTAQLVFERVMFERGADQAATADIVHAIGQTRRTLTPELVTDFEQDIKDYARV